MTAPAATAPTRPRPLELVYGALALLGLGITWYFNLQFFTSASDRSVLDFAAGGYANPAAASLSSDILVVGVAHRLLRWSAACQSQAILGGKSVAQCFFTDGPPS